MSEISKTNLAVKKTRANKVNFAHEWIFNEENGPFNKIFQLQHGLTQRKWLHMGEEGLLLASSCGHVHMVQHFLSNGVEKNALNEFDWSALMLASRNGFITVVQILILAGADLNIESNNGDTALMIAFKNRHPEVVGLLIKHGAMYSGNRNPFIGAAQDGHTEMIISLLMVGAPVNVKGENDVTALMAAASNNHAALIELLLLAGAKVDLKTKSGMTALILSIKYHGNTHVCKALLDATTEVDHQNDVGESALYFAARTNKEEITKSLLSAGATIEGVTSKGYTILLAAVKSGNAQMVTIILNAGGDKFINVVHPKYGETPLLYAARKGYYDIVKVLISAGSDIDMLNEIGSTPLLNAARNGNTETVKVLVDRGCNKNAQDCHGYTAIMYAVLSEFDAIVHFLLSKNVDLSLQNCKGDTVLMHAVACQNVELVGDFIELNVDLDMANNMGDTVLMQAARLPNPILFDELIDAGASVNAQNTENGSTALIIAARGLKFPFVRRLIEAKANLNLQDVQGQTALFAASLAATAHQSSSRVVEVLCSAGADVTIVDSAGRTALMAAALLHDTPSVLYLLNMASKENGLVSKIDKVGRTTLIYVTKMQNVSLVQLVLSKNSVQIDNQSWCGRSALMIAAELGSVDVLQTLLEAGANLSLTLGSTNPLDALHLTHSVECAQLLLRHGAKVQASHISFAETRDEAMVSLLSSFRGKEV